MKRLQSPFVTTVAAAAMVAGAACTNDVIFNDGSGGNNLPFVPKPTPCDFGDPGCEEACPGSQPSNGSACNQEGQVCYYEDFDLCEGDQAECAGGSWEVTPTTISCNPPPPIPECPMGIPVEGEYCDFYGDEYSCSYVDPICTIPINAYCSSAGWSVDQIECNPPPPELCPTFGDSATCESVGSCRWLVPGCGQPALETEGCYPIGDCVPGSCFNGEVCQTVVADPCWNQPCDACAMDVSVCLP